MKIQLDTNTTAYSISSYRSGQITVNDEVLTQSFVIMPDVLIRDWPPQDFDSLAASHFESVAGLKPEIVLFGSGARLRFPPTDLVRPFIEQGFGLEVMDTGAACRTFNILVSEGRRVAAALLMIRGPENG